MVKSGPRARNLNSRRENLQKKVKPTQKQSQCVRTRENFVQFFEFLKDHHALENPNQASFGDESSLLQEVSMDILSFFNEKKSYTILELDRHVVYLANLMGVLGKKVRTLTFKSEFKIKIKRMISSFKQGGRQKNREESVQKALFYILALLIYREGEQNTGSLQTINRSIYSDRKLVKELLSLTIIGEKKTSKYFGVILIHLCAKYKGKYLKEDMIGSIFRSIGKFEDECIFFQLLGFLRRQMNRTSINLQYIREGQIVKVLFENYRKYFGKQQSYLILEYINYLVTLFPTLAEVICSQKYYEYLLYSSNQQNFERQSATIKIADQILSCIQLDKKSMILENFLKNIDLNEQFGKRLLPLIIKHETDLIKLTSFLNDGIFTHLFEQIMIGNEEQILKDKIDLLLILIKKIEKFNPSMHLYLKYWLKLKIESLSDAWRMKYQHLIRLDEQSL